MYHQKASQLAEHFLKKFFGGHVSEVVLVVRDFKDELIDLCPIVVHGARWQVTLGGVLNSSSSLNWLGT
jgi:hypothetical protein